MVWRNTEMSSKDKKQDNLVPEEWWYTEFRKMIATSSDEDLPGLYDRLYDEYLCKCRGHQPHENVAPVKIDGDLIQITDILNDYRIIRFLIKEFMETGSILELGCGASSFAYIMATDGYCVAAVDMRQKVIENHRKYIPLLPEDYRWNLRFDCALAEKLPYSEDSFNVIVGVDFIEHVRTPQRVMTECLRVLKPGGRIYFATPIEGIQWSPEHLYNYTKPKLENLFNYYGLKSKFYFERYFWCNFEPNVFVIELMK